MHHLVPHCSLLGFKRGSHGLLKSRQGRPIIAHRANGGLWKIMEPSPAGTKELYPREARPKIIGHEKADVEFIGLS
jgi:hypothetical protein